MAKLTAEERKWQAQDDAYTLARAEEIKASAGRQRAAKTAAKAMLKEEQKRTQALAKVADSDTSEAPVRRTNRAPAALAGMPKLGGRR